MMDLDTLYTTMQPGHTDPGMVEYQPIDNSILFGTWPMAGCVSPLYQLGRGSNAMGEVEGEGRKRELELELSVGSGGR